jgi:hypothetical protein
VRINSLKRYQRPHRVPRFDDLPPSQRAAAEAHFQRLCARWGDDLPQWRRAILVGRARDLVARPRDGTWARRLRNRGRTRPAAPRLSTLATPQDDLRPAMTAPMSVAVAPAPVTMASPGEPVQVASSLDLKVAPSLPEPSIALAPSVPAVRLDIRGISASGIDGADTAQRILRDLEHQAFGNSPHFSMAVPGKDLPPQWAWRLEVVPVP